MILREVWEARVAVARNATERATALNGLTRSLLEVSVDEAKRANERALQAAAAAADQRCTAEAIRNRASIALVRRDLDASRADYELAGSMAEALAHGGLWASAQIGIAVVCRLRSDYDGAIARLSDARQRAGEAGDHATQRLAWNYLASVYLEMVDFPSADAAASACWASAEEAGDDMLALACSAQLWRARFAAAAPERCRRGLERCLAGVRGLGDRLLEAQMLVQIGRLELQMGHPDTGLQQAKAALAIADASGDAATAADAILLVGECHQAVGNKEAALERYRHVRTFAVERGMVSLDLAVRRAEARLYDQSDETDKAEALWLEIDAMSYEQGFWHPAMEAASALARVAMARGDLEAAEDYLARRDIARDMLAWENPPSDETKKYGID